MGIKLSPTEWQAKTGITIMDPDGWRIDNKSFDEPIDEAEWNERMFSSTISYIKLTGVENE